MNPFYLFSEIRATFNFWEFEPNLIFRNYKPFFFFSELWTLKLGNTILISFSKIRTVFHFFRNTNPISFLELRTPFHFRNYEPIFIYFRKYGPYFIFKNSNPISFSELQTLCHFRNYEPFLFIFWKTTFGITDLRNYEPSEIRTFGNTIRNFGNATYNLL